ncbi:unnamed protein product, partial [marine sediment metagenome]
MKIFEPQNSYNYMKGALISEIFQNQFFPFFSEIDKLFY